MRRWGWGWSERGEEEGGRRMADGSREREGEGMHGRKRKKGGKGGGPVWIYGLLLCTVL